MAYGENTVGRFLLYDGLRHGLPYGKYPKLQILTIKDLFAGKKPNIPMIDSSVFKKAALESTAKQARYFSEHGKPDYARAYLVRNSSLG